MKFAKPKVTPEATFDLTNMIDVVLLLIIFFMLTAQFAKSNERSMDLPVQKGAAEVSESDLAVSIALDKDGTLLLHETKMDQERLLQVISADARRMKRPIEQMEITIRADKSASASRLNGLILSLSRIGVKKWKLATHAEEGG